MSITPLAVPPVREPADPALPLWRRIFLTLRYLFTLEVHVFAFAIAANFLLCFFPFSVLLLSLCRNVLHYQPAYDGVMAVLQDALPSNQSFITSRLALLAQGHRKAQFWSFVLLLFSSNGVLLPLEMALNSIWGLKNRNYFANQAVALVLTFSCGCLAFMSMLATGANRAYITDLLGTSDVAMLLSRITLKIIALPVTVSVFFVLYYFLPHGKVPAAPMFRAAVFAGILMEAAKYLYILSLPYLNFQEAYGPFYVSVTLLLWGFLAAMILLVGAYATAVPGKEAAI